MIRFLIYVLIVISLGLTLNANSKETYGTIRIPTVEKCNSFSKGDTNWYYNNCDQLGSLKSGLKINKKDKILYTDFSRDSAFWYFYPFKINDLRGDGVVYYKFIHDSGPKGEYYRINKNLEVISKGKFKYSKDNKRFLLIEGDKKFFWKIAPTSQIVDIRSKLYDYKGYRRYQIEEVRIENQELLKSSIQNYENRKYTKVDSNQNNVKTISLKSGLDINKKDKVDFDIYKHGGSFFWGYSLLINDLRGNGPVYYKFNINEYHRLDENFKVLSRGSLKEKKKKGYWLFELEEDNITFEWKISIVDKIVDIKSSFYDYKGFKRYHIKDTTKEEKKIISKSIAQSKNNQYVKIDSNIDSTKDIKSSFGYEIAKTYDDSDDNLKRLWTLILEDKDIKKKYLKYSKKKATFKGKPIKSMGLAVFIDYKKELSIITKDKNVNKLSSPIAWGWEYSNEDYKKKSTVFDGFEAIRNCYKNVRKKKLSLRDGECLLVDVRRITTDSQYPVIWHNYLIEAKNNRILLAEASEKSKQQIASEKKEEEKKKKT